MSILPSINNLPKGKNLLMGLTGELFKLIKNPSKDNKDSGQKAILVFVTITSIFFIVVTEPLKVIFRKRIGEQALDIGGVIFGCSLYLAWAIILLGIGMGATIHNIVNGTTAGMSFDSIIHPLSYSLLSASICYFILTFYILFRGMDEYYRAKSIASTDFTELIYRGDSILMENYKEKGWSKNRIWHTAEPRTAVTWGLLLTVLNPLLGLPIVFTSLSFWINEWYHGVYKPGNIQSQLRNAIIQEQLQNLTTPHELSDDKFYVR